MEKAKWFLGAPRGVLSNGTRAKGTKTGRSRRRGVPTIAHEIARLAAKVYEVIFSNHGASGRT